MTAVPPVPGGRGEHDREPACASTQPDPPGSSLRLPASSRAKTVMPPSEPAYTFLPSGLTMIELGLESPRARRQCRASDAPMQSCGRSSSAPVPGSRENTETNEENGPPLERSSTAEAT